MGAGSRRVADAAKASAASCWNMLRPASRKALKRASRALPLGGKARLVRWEAGIMGEDEEEWELWEGWDLWELC